MNGYKGSNFEGGFRVPFIVRWPGKVAEGTESEQVIALADILATAAGLLGKELPESAGGDSYDFSPVLLGKNVDGPIRRSTILQTGRGLLSFRHDNWKLRFSEKPNWNGQEVELPQTSYELYNLSDDPAETNDLSKKHQGRAEEMKTLLLDLLKKGRSK